LKAVDQKMWTDSGIQLDTAPLYPLQELARV